MRDVSQARSRSNAKLFVLSVRIIVVASVWASVFMNVLVYRYSQNGRNKSSRRSSHTQFQLIPDPVSSHRAAAVQEDHLHRSNASSLPTWMLEYLDWHREQRKLDSNSTQYLVVSCLNSDWKCGGTADRLKPLPFYVLMAARLRRVLVFYWERPCDLTHFLQPRTIDWRWSGSADVLDRAPKFQTTQDLVPFVFLKSERANLTFVKKVNRRKFRIKELPAITTIVFQSHDHGASVYNELAALYREPSFELVFRELWETVFVPSEAVQRRIDQSMTSLGLEKDKFVSVHIRSQYHSAAGIKQQEFLVRNAVNCASRLRSAPDIPIYVATDALQATREAMRYGENQKALMKSRPLAEPLHLDRGTSYLAKDMGNWTKHRPEDYFDTFVDLYMLAASSCTTVNVGNFGKWANLMSSNRSCYLNHLTNTCRWKSFP